MVTPPLEPETWYTVEQAAAKCDRSIGTIRNLVSKHHLPRRLLWRVYRRRRQRAMFLSPATVAYLQRITIHGEYADQVIKPKG